MSAPNLPQWYIHDIAKKVSEILDDDKVYTYLLSGFVEVYSLTNNLVVRIRFNGSGFFYEYSAHRIQDLDRTTGRMTRSSCVYTSDNPDGTATKAPEMSKIIEAVEGLMSKENAVSQAINFLDRYFNSQDYTTSIQGSTICIWFKTGDQLFAENWGSFTIADDLVAWVHSRNHLDEITDILETSGFKVRNQNE